MNNKYKIAKVHICTFKFEQHGIRPELNKYPIARLCVIDTKNNVAVDVGHECKYDFIETASMINFMNGAAEKIRENKRAAICPCAFLGFENREQREKTQGIIIKLENGYKFLDGNDLFTNEEYLKMVNDEREKELKTVSTKAKQKKIGRKK